MKKNDFRIELLIAICSVILGIIIGPIFEKFTDPLFSNETRAGLISILVLGLLVIAGITAVGIYIQRDESNDRAINITMQDIRKKLGLSAQFLTALPRGEGKGELYRKVTEIVSRAEKEIWILWYKDAYSITQTQEQLDKRSQDYKKARSEYYELLLNKCKEHKRDTFFYRRILQLNSAKNITDGVISLSLLNPAIRNHCKIMIDFIHQNPEAAIMKYSPVYFPHNLILIDDKYILWEIDGIDPDNQSAYMDGLIVFDDVNQDFIKYLKNFFQKIDARSSVVKELID